MRRRASQEEAEIGSDSFLDIIANIVGILIILIVVAGARVASTPVPIETKPPADATNEIPLPAAPADESAAPPELVVVPVPAPEPEDLPRPPAPKQPPPELLALADELETEIRVLEADQARQSQEFRKWTEADEANQQRLTALTSLLEREGASLARQQVRTAGMREDFEKMQASLTSLERKLLDALKQKTPVETIKHKLTPISRKVSGKELHFRLSLDRVAYVPLEELLARLQIQIVRQKEWLSKRHRHQGEIGPVRGFRMVYVVERQHLSVVEELQHGRGVMRIGLSNWQLIPDLGLDSETAEEALSPNSDFVRVLQNAEPETALTFWVYPGSFEVFRTLQKFAHREGFTVAARPLPFGVPIAGSPHGTRSSGQ